MYHRSEDPAQVFLILLVWMMAALQGSKVFLSYDVYNPDKLKDANADYTMSL